LPLDRHAGQDPPDKNGCPILPERPDGKQVCATAITDPKRADNRLVTRHVPKSLLILTRSAPKKNLQRVCASRKDATLAAAKLPKNKPQNELPKRRHFAAPTTDGLKQAR
jgi:hypothetical protein